MKEHKFRGLGIALITPFRADGTVDYDALLSLVDYQIKAGADFLCVLGTTAETPCLTADERQTIKERVVKHVRGRVSLLIGCGGNNTAAVVEEFKQTDWTGIDGILSVCPMYNKPTQEGLYQHYRALSEASPLPLVLYNVPGRTGVNMTADTTLRLAHDFDNIVAIKEASGKLDQIKEILEKKPQGFDVLSGDDSLTLSIMKAGGVGIISVVGNAIPQRFGEMVHLMQEGRLAEATIINDELFELYSLMFIDGNPAGVKSALNTMGRIENRLRLPLVPVTERTGARIATLLAAIS
ncbi:MAG: 4-hydroxy-tetrahydrodipicolinate synthase [Bacteroidaceae bacterium]|nr:4-hydroxy-tetrahydrodipicolinate synthase [Bacteroidaceae bacterium]